MRGKHASWTAIEVARKVVALSYDPLLSPPLPAGAGHATVRLLSALRLLPGWQIVAARSPSIQRIGYRLGNWLGGHPSHFGLRKRFVDDEVRSALATDARQVLVVGAGFDTLALR